MLFLASDVAQVGRTQTIAVHDIDGLEIFLVEIATEGLLSIAHKTTDAQEATIVK